MTADNQADVPGRPRRPVQEALAHDHRGRPRRRGGRGPDPAPLRTVHLDRRYVGDITYVATWEGGPAPSWSKTPLPWRSPTGHHSAASFSIRTEAEHTSGDFAELAREKGVVLFVGRKGECWDNVVAESFLATTKRELIARVHGRRGPDFGARSSSTSRAGTTSADCTGRSATSVPPNTKLSTTTPTVRRHNQHKRPVRRTGSSSNLNQSATA